MVKATRRIAKTHAKVANKRKDFHYKTVNHLLKKAKYFVHQHLNTKGLAKTNKAMPIHYVGWSALRLFGR